MLIEFFSLAFLIFLFFYGRHKNPNSMGNGLMLFLIVNMLCALLAGWLWVPYRYVLIMPTLYLVAVFLIWIYPFNKACLKPAIIENAGRSEYYLSILMIILALPSTLHYLGKVIELFSSQSADVLLDHRLAVNNADISETRSWSIENLFIAGAQFYVIPLYLFFISIIKRWKKWFSALLLVSSLSFPLYCLSRFGRDGIVFWIINLMIMLGLFSSYLTPKTRKRMWVWLGSISGTSMVLLVIVSMVRFSSDFSVGTISYMGQSISHFSEVWNCKTDYSPSMFSGIRMFLGLPTGSQSLQLYKSGLGHLTNVFSSFVATIILSYGKFGGVLFSILISLIVVSVRRKTFKNNSNFGMMILFVIMQVPMNGVFYYRQGIGNGDVYLLLSILLLLVFPHIITNPQTKKVNTIQEIQL